MFRFNTQNTLRIAFVAIIITISGVFIISFRNSKGVRDTTTAVKKTQSVLLDGQELVNAILENESAARGYVISGNPEFLSLIRYTKGIINEEFFELDSTLVKGGSEVIVESQLLPLVSARVAYSDEMVRVYDSLGPAAANKLVISGRGKALTDSVKTIMDLIKNQETAALAVREYSNQSSVRKLNVILYSMLGFVLLFGLLALTRIAFDFRKMHSQQARLRDYTELVEHSHVVAWDMNKGILFWNEGMEGLYGWKKEEVMGKMTHEVFKTEFPLPLADIEKILHEKGNWSGELKHTCKNGSVIYVSSHWHLHVSRDGKRSVIIETTNDITDQKEAETALASLNETLERKVEERTRKLMESEQRYRIILENVVEGVMLFSEDREVLYQSPSILKIGGRAIDERTKIHGFQTVYPEDYEIVQYHFEAALRNPGVPQYFQARLRHKKGHSVWLEANITNHLETMGINAVVMMGRDITERKLTEQRLNDSEKRFRALIEYNYDGILLADDKDQVVYQSPSAAKISGWNFEERRSQPSLGIIHPDDLPQINIITRFVRENPGKPYFGSCRRLKKDGNYQWIEFTQTNLLHDKNVSAIVTNLRDITDKKLAEEKLLSATDRLESVLQRMGDGFMILNAEWEFVFTNNQVFELFGINPERMIGKRIWDFNPGLAGSLLELEFKAAMETADSRNFEFLLPDKNKWIYFRVNPIPGGISVFFNDITKQKTGEQELKKLHRELEQKVEDRTAELQKANRELEAFTYSVSHDLRAPLRGIIGFTSILEEDYSTQLDVEARRITGIIKNNTTKMGQLIDDLLAFSRVGRAELQKTEMNQEILVREIRDDIARDNSNRQIEWLIHPLPPVRADINSFRQVWINLISNAVKYSGKVENPVIEIGGDLNNGQVTYYVKDNGVGFDEKYAGKLFRVFQRLHSSDEFEGTGVGLAIVDKIISKHGGRVWARSEPGQGACFSFSVPAH